MVEQPGNGLARFWVWYLAPSTCPSDWTMIWEYDGNELYPIGYSWNERKPDGWMLFGKEPLDALAKRVRTTWTWEQK